MKQTYIDSDGLERHQRCGWLIESCECVTVPPGGWKAEATPEQVMQAGCPLCSALPGEPCDGSHYKVFVLGLFVKGLPHVHARRYQAAIKQAAA